MSVHHLSTDGKPKCSTCRFFQVLPNADGLGACKRHAPGPQLLPESMVQEQMLLVWPPVRPMDWCGEHAVDGLVGEILATGAAT